MQVQRLPTAVGVALIGIDWPAEIRNHEAEHSCPRTTGGQRSVSTARQDPFDAVWLF